LFLNIFNILFLPWTFAHGTNFYPANIVVIFP